MNDIDLQSASEYNENADYLMKVISFNLGLLLSNKEGKSQTGLARVLGVSPQAVSRMIQRHTCSTRQLLIAAQYLDTTPTKLMDDTVMNAILGTSTSGNYRGVQHARPDTNQLAGSSQPRFLKKPDQDDDGSPKTPGVSGAPRFLALPSADDAALLRRRRGYLVALPIAVFVHTGVETRQLP